MNSSQSFDQEVLSYSIEVQIDRVCQQFEEQWKAGQQPHIERYLADWPATHRGALLAELLKLELAYRQQRGEHPSPQEYQSRFPNDRQLLQTLMLPQDARTQETAKSTDGAQENNEATIDHIPGKAESPPQAEIDSPQIEGYEIVDKIGQGGMGVVYKARHLKLNRLVALKMILAGVHAGEEEKRRFLAEAEAVAAFQHPNIVQVYDVGQHQNVPYMALELVSDGSLADRLNDGPLSAMEAAELVEQLAHAMNAAHQAGIVHRDLKPANVLIGDRESGIGDREKNSVHSARSPVPDPRSPIIPKITDFGLAKKVEGSGAITQTGAIVGTPSYMAPEQASGESKRVGPAADVYALGAILYECLTGRPPFKTENPMQTLMQVVKEEPLPPSQIRSRIPRDLQTICLKCLQKEPQKRYASAENLAEDLRRFQANEPIKARPVGNTERFMKWVKRHPGVSASLAVVLLVTLAGIGGICWAYGIALAQRDVAQAEKKRADDKAKEAKRNEDNALAQKKRADEETERVKKAEFALKQHLYSSQIIQANLEWQFGNVRRMKDLLQAQIPKRPEDHDFRGFEWYYLNRQLNKNLKTLPLPKTSPAAVTFSPDFKYLVSVSTGRLGIWEVSAGKEVTPENGFPEGITSFKFSPDGKHLFTYTPAENWEMREFPSGKLVGKLGNLSAKPEIAGFAQLTPTPDGKNVIAAIGGTIVTFDLKTGQKSKSFKVAVGDLQVYTCSALSPDGKYLAVGSHQETMLVAPLKPGSGRPAWVSLIETATGKFVRAFPRSDGVMRVAFSPDGKLLAAAGVDMHVEIYNVETLKCERIVGGHEYIVTDIAFSKDSNHLASGSSFDQTIRVWEIASGNQLRVLKGHSQIIGFDPVGNIVVRSGDGKLAKIWAWRNEVEPLTVVLRENYTTLSDDQGYYLAFHPNGNWLASVGNGLRLFDVRTGRTVRTFQSGLPKAGTFLIRFTADGKHLVGVSYQSKGLLEGKSAIDTWEASTGKLISTVPSTVPIGLRVLSPDGKLCAGFGHINLVVVDCATGKPIVPIPPEGRGVHAVAFARHSQLLAIGTSSGVVKLWDRKSGETTKLGVLQHKVLSLMFSADGKRLAAVSTDEVGLWDAASGKLIHSFEITQAKLAVFSDDCSRLATVGTLPKIAIWDTATGQQLFTLKGLSYGTHSLTFSPDGKCLAARGIEGSRLVVRIWDGTASEGE